MLDTVRDNAEGPLAPRATVVPGSSDFDIYGL